jgi:hypothetical protein
LPNYVVLRVDTDSVVPVGDVALTFFDEIDEHVIFAPSNRQMRDVGLETCLYPNYFNTIWSNCTVGPFNIHVNIPFAGDIVHRCYPGYCMPRKLP